jgi:hypothetical protein
MWRKRPLSKSKYYSGIIVDEMRTTRKNFRRTNVTGVVMFINLQMFVKVMDQKCGK